MTIKHTFRTNEIIHTAFGVVKLGAHGEVTNPDELNLSDTKQLLDLPNFVDGEIFDKPAPAAPTEPKTDGGTTPSAETEAADKAAHQKRATKDVIRSLLADDAAPRNTAGNLEIEFVNTKLTEFGLPTVTGGRRKEIEDEIAAEPKT